MSQEYPHVERRQDYKIDDIWKSLPAVRTDIMDIKNTVSKHDLALYGVRGARGEIVQEGLVDIVLKIPTFFRWLFGFLGTIIIGLAINFFSHYYGWVH